jgi:hypothetical protein
MLSVPNKPFLLSVITLSAVILNGIAPRIPMVYLLVKTILDQMLLILKIIYFSFYKTSYLNEEMNCTEPFPSVRVPWHALCRNAECCLWSLYHL